MTGTCAALLAAGSYINRWHIGLGDATNVVDNGTLITAVWAECSSTRAGGFGGAVLATTSAPDWDGAAVTVANAGGFVNFDTS